MKLKKCAYKIEHSVQWNIIFVVIPVIHLSLLSFGSQIVTGLYLSFVIRGVSVRTLNCEYQVVRKSEDVDKISLLFAHCNWL